MSFVLLISGATGIADATARKARDRGLLPFTIGLDAPASCIADLREESQVQAAVQACLDAHGRIDALFNVAGISARRYGDGPLHECTLEAWNAALQSNLNTAFLLSKHVLRHWLDQRQPGAILHMSSVLADSPEPRHFATHAYAASKGALIALTRSMSAFYAPYNIRINAIAPGLVRTPMTARAQSDPGILEFIRHKQPLSGGMLDADDIADAALFLLSPGSRNITGQVLFVDGGWSISS